VEQRLAPQPEARRRHLVHVDGRRRGLQRPGLVTDDGGDQPAAALSEEAVALDEEVLERARLGMR